MTREELKLNKHLIVDIHKITTDCGYNEDFYAKVWNWVTLKTENVHIGIDYSHILEFEGKTGENERLAYLGSLEHRRLKLLSDKVYDFKKGYIVLVVAGRNVPRNTVGEIQSYNAGHFDQTFIKTADNKVYKTYRHNLQVIGLPVNERPGIDFKALNFYRKCLHQLEFNKNFDERILK